MPPKQKDQAKREAKDDSTSKQYRKRLRLGGKTTKPESMLEGETELETLKFDNPNTIWHDRVTEAIQRMKD